MENFVTWPSGDCKPVLATELAPENLVRELGVVTFRDKDDLDWFEGAYLNIDEIGSILMMRHDNNPKGLTAFYVDYDCDPIFAEMLLIRHFKLLECNIAWRSSADLL
ncbi:hypothetical protein RBA41_08240 [Massilia sp. CCM 9210]|uniref:hypothetical protein n=1 Tax=Massilia scottii TaxID=3057166 RepID=UPI0027967EDF|nr:hypothetical protein [Massilia sp. CCM 9210]MDQ1813291.1 hypothetical protein [Massilia sp. CCM 9210]